MANYKNTKISGIYAIKNTINHKIYIGSSFTVGLRWSQHLNDLIHNEHYNDLLQNDFNLYNISDFSYYPLEIFETTDINELRFKEKLWIDYFKENNFELYNKSNVASYSNRIMGKYKNYGNFEDYINRNWLVQNFNKDVNKSTYLNYIIYKKEDKNNIISSAQFFNLPVSKSKYSFEFGFTSLSKYMIEKLGYIIINVRTRYNGIVVQGKLIIGQNKESGEGV